MKKPIRPYHSGLIFVFFVLFSSLPVFPQYTMPAVMDTATIESQLDYLEERTRIYNDFRAIRNDIFLRLKQNSLDTLNNAKMQIDRLQSEMSVKELEIDGLHADLSKARNERDEAIRTKDSFALFGLQIQKGIYNTVLWIIVAGLAALGIFLFLMFKRSHVVTSQTRKELDSTLEEFEDYRKSSREKYEKLVISHHNEIMKLKRG